MKTFPTACTCSIPPRVEVTIRIALVTFVASTLAVAYLPSAIPPALSQLIGIFGVSFALSLPHVFFIIGAAIVVGLLGGTALLAAATVSSGVYVAVFAIYALYCTSLSYGADATGIVAFFSLPIGPTAFFGLDQNSGMVGMYITMTQALVALEVAMGVGERDVITANRVVATVTGVLMAMVVAVVPPQRRGSDVEPIKALLQQIDRGSLRFWLPNHARRRTPWW